MKKVFDLDDSESWRIANQLLNSVGPLCTLYTSAIRAVRSAPSIIKSTDPEKIKKFSIDAIGFPVRVTPTIKSMLYYIAEELDREGLSAAMPLDQVKLLQLFSPDEMIAVISLTYTYRLLKRHCDSDEWARLIPKLTMHTKVGYLVGQRMRGVGGGNGMLLAGLRVLSQALFIYGDLKGFKTMRRKLESKGLLFDLKEEEDRWGCNHLHIASHFIASLGYGVGPRMAYGMLSHGEISGNLQPAVAELKDEIEAFRTAINCTEALHAWGTGQKKVKEVKNTFLPEAVAQELERTAIATVKSGKGFGWLLKTVHELSSEIKEQLSISQEGQGPIERPSIDSVDEL